MTYKIEKGIEYIYGHSMHSKFPLEIMEVGDSFVVPKEDVMDVRASIQIVRQKLNVNKKDMKTFRTKKLDNQGNVRVWRIE